MMNSAAFLGLATVDIVYEVDGIPVENEKAVAIRQDVLCGGPAANAAITCAFLGATVKFAGAVGRHLLTRVIHEEFRRFGVVLHDIDPESSETPSISSIFVNPKTGSRTIISGHATRVQVPASAFDAALLEDAALLMVDGHQMAYAIAAACAAKDRGITVVLDGGSWKERTEELLEQTTIAICSEAFRPPGTTTLTDVIEYLLGQGIAYAAITRGADSIIWASRTQSGEITIPECDAIDTLAAGDIFHGAFCRRCLDGATFVDALTYASNVASCSCRFFGPRAWMKAFRNY